MKLLGLLSLLFSLWWTGGSAAAAVATFSATSGAPSAAAVAAGTPPGAYVYRLFTTTESDIVAIRNVKLIANPGFELFNVAPPFGSNSEPPAPAFVALNRALEADSWISTPGVTTLLGSGLPVDGSGVWYDSTDDGPQTDFHFATLTMPHGATFTLSATLQLAGTSGVQLVSFDVDHWGDITVYPVVPEPHSFGIAMVAFALAAASRRYACRTPQLRG